MGLVLLESVLIVVLQVVLLGTSHYWPERERWHILHRYTFGSVVVAGAWTINVQIWLAGVTSGLIPSPPLEAATLFVILLLWLHYAVGGAATTFVYQWLDPWLKRRSRGRRAGMRIERKSDTHGPN